MTYEKEEDDGSRPEGIWASQSSNIAFAGSCLLLLTSIAGASLALTICSTQVVTARMGICQALAFSASFLSFVYVGIYLLAARKNEPIGIERPPIRPLHATCFIILRIASLMWICAAIACLVATLTMPACPVGFLCPLQKANTGVSVSACVISIFLMCILEKCEKPFETPAAFHIRPMIVCRISSFGDEILEHSVSRPSSFENEKRPVIENSSEKSLSFKKPIKRKPVPDPPTLVTGRIPTKLSATTLAMSQSQITDSWTHEKTIKKSGSSGSVPSDFSGSSGNSSHSSDSSVSDCSSSPWNSDATTARKSHKAKPSSSISSSSRRSPLSTMRVAAYPDVIIEPQLRIFPAPIQLNLQHSYSNGTMASHRQNIRPIQKRLSSERRQMSMWQQSFEHRNMRQYGARFMARSAPSTAPTRPLPAPPVPKKMPSTKRTTADIKVPGAYVHYENEIEAHARVIEESILARLKEKELDQQRLAVSVTAKVARAEVVDVLAGGSESKSSRSNSPTDHNVKSLNAKPTNQKITSPTKSRNETPSKKISTNENVTNMKNNDSSREHEGPQKERTIAKLTRNSYLKGIVSERSPVLPEMYFERREKKSKTAPRVPNLTTSKANAATRTIKEPIQEEPNWIRHDLYPTTSQPPPVHLSNRSHAQELESFAPSRPQTPSAPLPTALKPVLKPSLVYTAPTGPPPEKRHRHHPLRTTPTPYQTPLAPLLNGAPFPVPVGLDLEKIRMKRKMTPPRLNLVESNLDFEPKQKEKETESRLRVLPATPLSDKSPMLPDLDLGRRSYLWDLE